MNYIKIKKSKLIGNLQVPSSKSLSHRAIICASLADEESIINNLVLSQDIQATIEGMKKLGTKIEIQGNKALIKRTNSIGINKVIDCRESGSTLRFLIPLSIVLTDGCSFTGSDKLFERPLDVYYKIFEDQKIKYNLNNTYPLSIKGKLSSGTFKVPGNISSQFITGMLFSLPLLEGDSKIFITESFESKPYVFMTMDVMNHFNVNIEKEGEKTFYIKGGQHYKNAQYNIEVDYSQAAFFLIANEIGNEVKLLGLHDNSLQGDKEIINIIKKYRNNNEIKIDASQIPDLVPAISVLAALKEGHTTVIVNAHRLRMKECDRLKAVSNELTKLGAFVKETSDGLIIKGQKSLKGGIVNSWNDHRIAMSLAIAATRCENDVILENPMAVNKSYPRFWHDYKKLGGSISELNNR